MREVKATIKDSFHVHTLENEHRKESGLPLLTEANYVQWTRFLFDEDREYLLLFHGKQPVGMIWGHKDDWGAFVVEGRYLRPRFRTWKFKREMAKSWLSFRSRFVTIKMWARPGVKTRHQPLYTEVVLSKRG